MSEQQQERTLFQRLSESSHPIALIFFLGIRISSLLAYLFGLLFTKNFILLFITVILLLAADFWNVKNISGRLLVGLRWWNETDQNGDSIWVFETADPNRYINPIDSKVFWILLYSTPALWIALAIFAVLKFEFLSLILVIIAISLTLTNTLAFSKCDKFGKANNIATDMFGRVSGGLLNRINPLNFLNR
ncbi:hypothetical protein WICMUC_005527 [Wickerhamomyces mucosus]|uniref:Golgi apparatus membrane protein TVP23 n=1 Tax=Wickerhamomyces mucosus TaxID=1378264 RepID=A0A9P8T642_9ASCO|nr:hypothetical protein WICMUC_005527 [Wickerhamomyces mucosus]